MALADITNQMAAFNLEDVAAASIANVQNKVVIILTHLCYSDNDTEIARWIAMYPTQIRKLLVTFDASHKTEQGSYSEAFMATAILYLLSHILSLQRGAWPTWLQKFDAHNQNWESALSPLPVILKLFMASVRDEECAMSRVLIGVKTIEKIHHVIASQACRGNHRQNQAKLFKELETVYLRAVETQLTTCKVSVLSVCINRIEINKVDVLDRTYQMWKMLGERVRARNETHLKIVEFMVGKLDLLSMMNEHDGDEQAVIIAETAVRSSFTTVHASKREVMRMCTAPLSELITLEHL